MVEDNRPRNIPFQKVVVITCSNMDGHGPSLTFIFIFLGKLRADVLVLFLGQFLDSLRVGRKTWLSLRLIRWCRRVGRDHCLFLVAQFLDSKSRRAAGLMTMGLAEPR